MDLLLQLLHLRHDFALSRQQLLFVPPDELLDGTAEHAKSVDLSKSFFECPVEVLILLSVVTIALLQGVVL